MKNPNCDSVHCTQVNGEVRLLPTGGGSNAILCHDCYLYQIEFRKLRNKQLGEKERFELPAWETLTPYGGTDNAWLEVRPMQAANGAVAALRANAYDMLAAASRMQIIEIGMRKDPNVGLAADLVVEFVCMQEALGRKLIATLEAVDHGALAGAGYSEARMKAYEMWRTVCMVGTLREVLTDEQWQAWAEKNADNPVIKAYLKGAKGGTAHDDQGPAKDSTPSGEPVRPG